MQHGGQDVEAGRGGIGIGIGKGQVARQGRIQDARHRRVAVFLREAVVDILFDQHAGRIARDPVGELDDADAAGLEHLAQGEVAGNVHVGLVAAAGHVGDDLAGGHLADRDRDAFAVDLGAGLIEAVGDDIEPVVRLAAGEFRGGGDLEVDLPAALDRDREGADVGQGVSDRDLIGVDVHLGILDHLLVHTRQQGVQLCLRVLIGQLFAAAAAASGAVTAASAAAGQEADCGHERQGQGRESFLEKNSFFCLVFHLFHSPIMPLPGAAAMPLQGVWGVPLIPACRLSLHDRIAVNGFQDRILVDVQQVQGAGVLTLGIEVIAEGNEELIDLVQLLAAVADALAEALPDAGLRLPAVDVHSGQVIDDLAHIAADVLLDLAEHLHGVPQGLGPVHGQKGIQAVDALAHLVHHAHAEADVAAVAVPFAVPLLQEEGPDRLRVKLPVDGEGGLGPAAGLLRVGGQFRPLLFRFLLPGSRGGFHQDRHQSDQSHEDQEGGHGLCLIAVSGDAALDDDRLPVDLYPYAACRSPQGQQAGQNDPYLFQNSQASGFLKNSLQ